MQNLLQQGRADLFTRSSAEISGCGHYRYWLERKWDRSDPQVFVMLNPSTADAHEDDPTIRRCIGFAKREGAGGIVVVNLFAWRATDPRELSTALDPFGPYNAYAIHKALSLAADHQRPIICAWGAHRLAQTKEKQLQRRAIYCMAQLVCLGTTQSGAPKHPLCIKRDQPLISFGKEE